MQPVRVVAVLLAAVASFLFFAVMTGVFIIFVEGNFVGRLLIPGWLRFVATVSIGAVGAGAVARYVWRYDPQTSLPQTLFRSVLIGAVAAGVSSFVLGLVFLPPSNLTPLFVFLIVAPAGTVLGAVGGWVYWLIRGRAAATQTR